jgi:hypothetical protein
MRETRQSGSEGGVEFKPPSLPLFIGRPVGTLRAGPSFGVAQPSDSKTFIRQLRDFWRKPLILTVLDSL